MDRASSFAAVARALRGDGADVLTYDRAGYASAVEQPPFTSVRDAARDLLDRIDRAGARSAVAVGHSFGGHVAMAAALYRPDVVRAVGLFETPWSWQPFWPADTSGGQALAAAAADGPEAAAEVFLRTLVGDRVFDRLPDGTRRLRRAEGRALVADLASIAGEAPYDPASVPVPLVVAWGSETLAHHVAGASWILSAAQDAEPFVIRGATHGAHRSHPDEFAAFVRRVVARAQART